MPEVRELDIDLIKIDAEIQPREGLDAERVLILRERYQDKGPEEAFPPVIVYHDADGVFWLADGHYRLAAIREALSTDGPRGVRADIREGTKRDAIFCAAGANGTHGTQLTKQERRRVIERLLRDDDWRKLGDRAISRHVGVSNSFVSGIHNEIRAETASVLEEQMLPTETIEVKRNDQTYPMKKGKIGRSKRSKAQKTTTTTTPTISADPQDERTTNEEDDSNTNHNQQAADPQGFDDLRAAWIAATRAERRAFLDWLQAEPVEVYAGDTTAQAKRYESILSDVRNTFEDDTQ